MGPGRRGDDLPDADGKPGGEATEGAAEPEIKVKRIVTIAIGVFGGFLVGITSVGSGSLMIVMLMMTYLMMSMKRLVGTDIAVDSGSAAIGHVLFGGFEFGLTASIVVAHPRRARGLVAVFPLAQHPAPPRSSRSCCWPPRPSCSGWSAATLAITMGIVALIGSPVWAFIDGYVRSSPAAWRTAGQDRRADVAARSAWARRVRHLGGVLRPPAPVGFVRVASEEAVPVAERARSLPSSRVG